MYKPTAVAEATLYIKKKKKKLKEILGKGRTFIETLSRPDKV